VRIRTLPAASLSAEETDAWSRIQESNEALNSPYFCPAFTSAVARAREHVHVAILEDGGEIVGCFPFEKTRGGVARPVGDTFSDLHGVIAAPGASFDAEELIRACGVSIWDFDHLVAEQEPFRRFHTLECESPTMDLTGGFEAYCARRREAGSKKISQTNRKARKLEREVGPLRFEPEVTDTRVLQQVIDWKRKQCQRTGTRDYFSEEWALKLARDIHGTREEGFGGLLSALFVGERLAAAHLGMWSRDVCHWWFPVYDDEFSAYSPGSILLLRLAEFVAGEGRTLLELGKGGDAYKASFMTGARPLAEGSVIVPSLRGSLRKLRVHSKNVIRSSSLAAPVRAPLRAGLRWIRQRKRKG
jgi:CelD/BcsL family acetyltransferase involved in cellulose biosynthesis